MKSLGHDFSFSFSLFNRPYRTFYLEQVMKETIQQ